MAGLCAPLSTLRQYPHGYWRMTRGRCGSLLLHRDGLAPSTPCRSPGALRSTPINGHRQTGLVGPVGARFGYALLCRRELRPRQALLRLADCLSPVDFWPAETHRDPSGDKPQHELAGVTTIIWQVISKLDAVSSVFCHDPHFREWSVCRKAVPVNR